MNETDNNDNQWGDGAESDADEWGDGYGWDNDYEQDDWNMVGAGGDDRDGPGGPGDHGDNEGGGGVGSGGSFYNLKNVTLLTQTSCAFFLLCSFQRESPIHKHQLQQFKQWKFQLW